MRRIFGIPVVLSMLAVTAGVVPSQAGASVEFSIEARSGYCDFDDLEDDIDWDNMIVINNDRIGIWVMLPSGRWVFRCRDMWFDQSCYEWRYGAWWYDYNVSYGCHCHHRSPWAYCPNHGVRFHFYMTRHYPRYHTRHFCHSNGHYFRHGSGGHGYRHSDNHAPRIDRNGPAIHREKRSAGQYDHAPSGERSRTTDFTRESTQPVRTDGGNRIDRSSSSRYSGRSAEVVRERSSTRVRPSSNGTRVTKSETRREIRR